MVEQLLERLLDKQELRGVSRGFARKLLEEHLERHTGLMDLREERGERFYKTKEYAKLKKEFRAELRAVYGVFFTEDTAGKREKLIDALIKEPTIEHTDEVLGLHRSTKERLDYYRVIYDQLLEGIDAKSILDLGCGYNPFAYLYLPGSPEYHCVDIACSDLERIGEFLEVVAPAHTTTCADLTVYDELPAVDVAFCFKLFDSLEERERGITARLLERINAKRIIVSFPTQSISGSAGIKPRAWFENLITEKECTTVTLPNEQFFIITNQG